MQETVEQDKLNYKEKRIRASDGLYLYCRDYGSAFSNATPVVCLPGMTRNSRDFNGIADHLSQTRRVLTLDARGRGRSDYDPDFTNYNLVTEVGDVLTLISHNLQQPCVIIGTSRGGLQALILNGVKPHLTSGIILNDIGPEINEAGVARIFSGLQQMPPQMNSWQDAVAVLKKAHEWQLPKLSEEEWLRFAREIYADNNGKPELDYDPNLIRGILETASGPVDFWPQFRTLNDKPLLVLRGEHSDLLTPQTMAQMRRNKPDMTTLIVRDRGHTPFLTEPESIAAIDQFLEKIDANSTII